MGKKRKVFNRKGSYSAKERDPPIGRPVEIPAESPIGQAEPDHQAPPPVPKVKDAETTCHLLNNVRVRVLNPDKVFIEDITKRLNRLDSAVKKLNTNANTED